MVSVAAGAVANGRCENVDIAVGGVEEGDAVVFSVRGSVLEGVFFYGMQVTAAGTVRSALCNFSGGAMSAISDLRSGS